MTEQNQVIRVTAADIEQILERKDAIEKFNTKLRILREQSLYDSLTVATKMRMDMMQKAKNWLDMLEKRVFDATVINNLDIAKVISLMKYVSNVSLRLMAQMNDIEKIFKTYVESSLASSNIMPTIQGGNPNRTEDEKNIKDMLMKALTDAIKVNAEPADIRHAEIVETKPTPDVQIDGVSDIFKDLESLDVEIEKDILEE